MRYPLLPFQEGLLRRSNDATLPTEIGAAGEVLRPWWARTSPGRAEAEGNVILVDRPCRPSGEEGITPFSKIHNLTRRSFQTQSPLCQPAAINSSPGGARNPISPGKLDWPQWLRGTLIPAALILLSPPATLLVWHTHV